MKRRDFITLLGGAAAAWPLAARAQLNKSPVRMGFIFFGSPSNVYDQSLVEAFRQGLRQVGLVENRDIVLDVVWISGDPDKAVTEVLGRGVELLIPSGSSASVAAMHQTSTLPIVFINVGDPIAMGLVDSLSRPGRNATGFSDILAELSGKFVDLARELSKPHETVGYLWHTAWPDGRNRYQLTVQAAQTAGVKLLSRGIAEIAELGDAIAEMKQNRISTLIVQPAPLTYQHRDRIIDSATNNSLATVLAWPVAARRAH
jgi:putative ABC transport system substrate-binding protein